MKAAGPSRGPALTCANRIRLLDRHDQDAAVSVLARSGVIHHRANDVINEVVGGDHVDHRHRQKAVVLKAAKVSHRAGSPATPAHVSHGDPRHTERFERGRDLGDEVRADDALDQLHVRSQTPSQASPRTGLRDAAVAGAADISSDPDSGVPGPSTKSGYASAPISGISSPSSSTAADTRLPSSASTTLKKT